MASKLPESARSTYARQLADEAKTLVPGMERLAEIAAELRADDLYRLLGFDTWERFCVDYLGVSKSTANRWIAGPKQKSITAGQRVAAAQNAPIVESDALNSAKSSEGVAPASETVPEPTRGAPSGKSSAGSGPGMPQTRPGVAAPAGPSSGGAGIQPPPRPTGETTAPLSAPPGPIEKITASHTDTDWSKVAPTTTERPPSDRQLAARVVTAMQNVDPSDAGPVLTPEEATFLRQWAQRTLDAWKAKLAPPAPAEKPQRGQGTITRPADMAPKPPADTASRRQAWADRPRMPVNGLGKRHADDCSCLSCKAPKAVAK